MAKNTASVHNEIAGTSWLFNGFLLLSVAWLLGTMWASSANASAAQDAAYSTVISVE